MKQSTTKRKDAALQHSALTPVLKFCFPPEIWNLAGQNGKMSQY
jgi:hypothetical protein